MSAPRRGSVQQRLFQHLAIIAGKEKIRRQLPHDLDKLRGVGVLGLIDRQVIVEGQVPHRGEPAVLPGVVGMGDHRHDLVAEMGAQIDEYLQAGVADVVVTQEDEAHNQYQFSVVSSQLKDSSYGCSGFGPKVCRIT